MIDEKWTWKFYGYYSDDWAGGSHKPIVVRCDGCCQYRISSNNQYREYCKSCTCKKIFQGKGNPHYGKPHTEHTKQKMSIAKIGKIVSDEARRHISASGQGIPYEEWTGFSTSNNYCEKFDDECRESNREKYDNVCFICGKHQSENTAKTGKIRKLSVHHVDMNRLQGCDGNNWKLVPLCMICHVKAHSRLWEARIDYLLNDPSMLNK